MSDNKHNGDISEAERVLSHSSNDLQKEHADYTRVDKELLKYTSGGRIVVDEATNKRLKKLVNKRVLSVMVFTYFLQALDKGTLSFTSIMGIQEDTNLVGQQYSWLTTCIYIAILIVEYPINWTIQRVPVGKFLGFSIIIWGSILACHAVAKNFRGLVVLRTLLGIFEAVCQPTFVVLSGMWFKREEQASTVAYWYAMNGAQQIVGGLLAYCFTLIPRNPTLRSWQAIFIAYGCFSVVWGFFVVWFLPDSPMRAKCFTEEDKHLLIERVRSNQTGMQNKKFRKEQVYEALRDPQTWCYAGIAATTTLPTSGLGAFANIIIKSFNFTVLQTQLLAMVLGAYIMGVLFLSAFLVRRYNQNVLVMLGFIVPSFIGTIILMTVENTSLARKAGLLIAYYITLSFWSAQTLSISMISKNIAGQTKKTVVTSINFIFWAAGNAVGPQVFLNNDAPRYFTAFATHLGCYTALVFFALYLRWHLIRQNKRKDNNAAAAAAAQGLDAVVESVDGVAPAQVVRDGSLVHAFDDLTDRENGEFRYMY